MTLSSLPKHVLHTSRLTFYPARSVLEIFPDGDGVSLIPLPTLPVRANGPQMARCFRRWAGRNAVMRS